MRLCHIFARTTLAILALTACASRSPTTAVANRAAANKAPSLPGSFPALLGVAAADPAPVRVLTGSRFWRAQFSRDGRRLVALEMAPAGTSFQATGVATFDPLTGERLQAWPLPSPLSVRAHPLLAIDGNTLAMALDGALYLSRDGSPLTRIPDLAVGTGEIAVYGDGVLVHEQFETPIWTDGITHTPLTPCDSYGRVLFASGHVVCATENDTIARVDPATGELVSERDPDQHPYPWAAATDGVSVAFGGYAEDVEVRDLSTDTADRFSAPAHGSGRRRLTAGAGTGEHWVFLFEEQELGYAQFLSPQGRALGTPRTEPLLDATVIDTRGIVVVGPSLEHVNLEDLTFIDGIGTQPGGRLTLEDDALWTVVERGRDLAALRWSLVDGSLAGIAQRDGDDELSVAGDVDPVRAEAVLHASYASSPAAGVEVPSDVRYADYAIPVGEIGALVPGGRIGTYRTFWRHEDGVREGARLAVQDWMSGDVLDAAIDPATQQVLLSFDDWVGWWPLATLQTPTAPLATSTVPALPSSGIHTLFDGRQTLRDRPEDARRILTESGWLPESLRDWLPDILPDAEIEEAWRQVDGTVVHERTLFWRARDQPRIRVPSGFEPATPIGTCTGDEDIEVEGFFEAKGETLCIRRWTDSHRTAVVTHSEPVGDIHDSWAAGLSPVLRAHTDLDKLTGAIDALASCAQAVEVRHHVTGGAVWLTLMAQCPRVEQARLAPWCESKGLRVDADGGCNGDWGSTEVYSEHFSDGEMWLNMRL